jgi:hypothetical protein
MFVLRNAERVASSREERGEFPAKREEREKHKRKGEDNRSSWWEGVEQRWPGEGLLAGNYETKREMRDLN